MKKSLLVRLVSLLLITLTLSGCIWWVDDGGYRGGGDGRGEHHGDHHEHEGDHGGRR